MKKIHVDSSIEIHLINGIVHIILGSDDLSQKFYKEEREHKAKIKATSIVTMPLTGFVETLNIFKNFANEPHIKMVLDSYVEAGVLEEDKKGAENDK